MTDSKSPVLWIGGLVVAAAISAGTAVMFQGSKTGESIKAGDVAQIDVMREQINTLRSDFEKLSSGTLSRSELESIIDNINKTIIRRFGEDVQIPIDLVRKDSEKNEDELIAALQRISKNEEALKFIVAELSKLK